MSTSFLRGQRFMRFARSLPHCLLRSSSCSISRSSFTMYPAVDDCPLHLLNYTRAFAWNPLIFAWMRTQTEVPQTVRVIKRLTASDTNKPNDECDKCSNDEHGDKRFFWLLLFFACGLVTYVIRNQVKSRIPRITFDRFLLLLERGEVEEVAVAAQGGMVLIKLHNTYPGTKTKVVVAPLRLSRPYFERYIRKLEDEWGIPETDRLPIGHSLTPIFLQRERSSPEGYIIAACGFVVLYVLVALRHLSKGNIPPSILPKVSFSLRTTLLSRLSSFKELMRKQEMEWKSSKTEQSANNRFDSDRYSNARPFTWDPLGGFDIIKPITTDVKFKDVAGLHASKEEVMEFVSYLKDPKKYQELGAKLPKGALLLGPPGTGKTLLVKALANEAEVPFYCMAGSEFVEMIGGLGASRVRRLFAAARSSRPSIIFIDELDSVGRRRDGPTGDGRYKGPTDGVSEMEHTLNQLLVEMDGMDTAEGTIVFAATNRSDLLDKALLRAGRFDRHIFIDLPNIAERKELLAMYVAKYRISPTVCQSELIDRLATWTPGMSGADISRLCNEAALIAARRDDISEGVTKDDFDMAFERVLAGAAKQSNPLSIPERRVAAVQEAGRALVAWLLPRTRLVPVKISIVPRTSSGLGGDLGFTHLVSEDRRLFNTEELNDRMAVMLGGRAAEQVIFKAVSDASQRYLREATDLAFKQVREWGLSRVIGNLSFEGDASGNQYTIKPYSQRTQAIIELEAQRLVTSAFARCLDLLTSNKPVLQALIEALLQKEVLTYDELVHICENKSSTSSNVEPD